MRRFAVTAIVLSVAACDADDARQRTEPAPATDGRACALAAFVCQQPGEAWMVDSTDPLWTFCHTGYPFLSMEDRYAPGSAEVSWGYDDAGGIERIDVQCLDNRPYVVVPERDEMGRVVRWDDNGQLVDLVYDDAGAIVTSTRHIEGLGMRVSSLTYEDDGKLDTVGSDWLYEGEIIDSGTLDLIYDGDHLVRTEGSGPHCTREGDFVRDAVRLIEVRNAHECDNEDWFLDERTYQWSGDEVTGSTSIRTGTFGAPLGSDMTEWEEEVRYRYGSGRVEEVQRDRDGEPHATYWYEYDETGRPIHLVWWGHVDYPLPFP